MSKKAMYIRRGDVIFVGDEWLTVEAEEDFGLRKAIYTMDGRCWMKRQTDEVEVAEKPFKNVWEGYAILAGAIVDEEYVLTQGATWLQDQDEILGEEE
jgi:hypothetical protein